MTRDELKAQLHRYRDLKAEQKQLQREIQRIEATMAAPKGSNLDGMPRSPGAGDPVLRAVAQHMALLERYKAQEAKLAAAQTEIEDLIESLDSLERRLMRHRYIEGLGWEEVCVVIGYSWRQAHNIHARALDQLLTKQEGETHEGQGN